ncbi:MAG: hypothetical protein PHX07_05830 [Candidatus Marinimicrobia bacterium]|nr:hypothetical protein [Candidatus Neomarinimicrobiota bacterium]MDD4961739.1 hypothetical protein [Candidatus Neomarinimicrobiota bacterium]MDD5709169.1 hypothetical protein [Candidatus Neomarinimicrobiota bacterium]
MIRFDVTHSLFILLFCALIVLFTLYWNYRFLRRDFYPTKIRRIIVILRSLALLLLLPLLLDLEISLTRNVEQVPLYAFVWDLSASMQNTDGTHFQASQVLNGSEYRSLRKKIRIEHIAGMREPALRLESELRQKKSDETVTDLGKLLRFADKAARYRGIVLISDGQSYLGELLPELRLSSGIPIFAVAVGDTLRNGGIALRSVRHPAFITEDDSLLLHLIFENPANVNAGGFISILNGPDTLYREKMELEARRFREYRTRLPGMTAGNKRLDFYFNEDLLDARAIQIFPSHIRVVCDSREADPDIAMINTVLSVEADYRIYSRDSWEKRYPGEKPDLLIQIWHPQEAPLFFENVPAILFYRESGAMYRQSGEFRIAEYRPYLLPEKDPYLSHLYWKQLPPVYLLKYPGKGKAVLESGEGLALVLEDRAEKRIIISGSGFWRWQLSAYEKGWEGLYRHWVNGMVREILKSGEGHFISFDRNEYRVLQYTTLAAITQSYDAAIADMADARVSVSLHDADFAELQRREHVFHSSMRSDFMPGDTGRYYLMARLFVKGSLIESDTAAVQVLYHDPETRYRGCNAEALKSLSANHGGAYLPLEQLDSLEKLLPAEKEIQTQNTVFQARRAYAGILILLLLLCAEWIIRKRNGSV